jgi:hypothetical protein
MTPMFVTTSALALLIAGPMAAQTQADQQQDAEQPQEQAMAAEGPFVQPQEADLFATRLMGVQVFAPGGAVQEDAFANFAAQGQHTVDTAVLAEFVEVGQVSDVLLTRDGDLRAVVIALGTPVVEEGATPPTQGTAVAPAPPAGTGVAPGTGVAGFGFEVAIEAGQVAFVSDETVPTLTFAIIGVDAQSLREAPMVEREMAAAPGALTAPGAQPGMGWRWGRAPMTAPAITMEGYAPTPVAEVSLDELTGANVYGADGEIIGNVGDVVLGADGMAEYALVDIGGFLGIGTREVAIGFDEMTVLQDANFEDLQVHVGATRQTLEQMPEHQVQ